MQMCDFPGLHHCLIFFFFFYRPSGHLHCQSFCPVSHNKLREFAEYSKSFVSITSQCGMEFNQGIDKCISHAVVLAAVWVFAH